MWKSGVWLWLTIALLQAACSKDYTPAAHASGQFIFQEACAACHKAENKEAPGMIFTLTSEQANLAFITEIIHSGSLLMPNFPNIKDVQLQLLSDYVLNHSIVQK